MVTEVFVSYKNKVLGVKVEVFHGVDFRVAGGPARVGQNFNAELDIKLV
jgi:hypothetical protein